MTAEERARLLILEDWHEHGEDDVCEACKHEQAIADVIRQAENEVREECARVADKMGIPTYPIGDLSYYRMAKEVAKAIRESHPSTGG